MKRYGRLVEREARRFSELIAADTLEHAGIESGRDLERSELVSVAELIEDARKACRWLAEDEGVTVEADFLPVACMSWETGPRSARASRTS